MRTFAELLVGNGVDADLDLWHQHDTGIDWTRWGQRRVNECDFVIIAISTAWKQRWEGTNAPTVGAGAAAEADTLKGQFNTNQEEFQRRTLVVLLPGVSLQDLPADLHRLNRSVVSTIDAAGIEDLLRKLTNQPLYARPPLGQRPALPSAGFSTPEAEKRSATPPAPGSSLTGPSSNTPSRCTERQRILKHPITSHGVVLAGPGTGKSTTVLDLATLLRKSSPNLGIKIISFTRAATQELISKIREAGHEVDEPTTMHSFALSVLTRNPGQSQIPHPLRIPDTWETRELIQPDLSRRLRRNGYQEATPTRVEKLIHEMSAGWESMDPDKILLSDLDPSLRTAFRAAWQGQRQVFGYTLFAEMTYAAAVLLEDLPSPDLDGLEFLIVDEYQDLNRADISMIAAVAQHGVAVLAVGDDDQSIYGFRHAAPQGIRDFSSASAFPGALKYSLSTSYRCGSRILAAAREVIETSPLRAPKPPLHAAEGNPDGEIAYLRFPSEGAEVDGVSRLVEHLIRTEQVPANQVIILVRADHNRAWSTPLRQNLESKGIPVVDPEQFRAPLKTDDARRLIATARLVRSDDDLAWWTLLKLTNGVGGGFVAAVADEALANQERFHTRLLRLADEPLYSHDGTSAHAERLALTTIEHVLRMREIAEDIESPDTKASITWADWLFELAKQAHVPIAEDLRSLLIEAATRTASDPGVGHFLASLDEVAQELALEEPGVAIMSMNRSKGLTRTAVFIMGVEEGIVPPAREGTDYEEERRLLYVAMTRARSYLYCTMATRRTGQTARTGGGIPGAGRTRSRFLRGVELKPQNGLEYVLARVS